MGVTKDGSWSLVHVEELEFGFVKLSSDFWNLSHYVWWGYCERNE